MKTEPDTSALMAIVRNKANLAPRPSQEYDRMERAAAVRATYKIEECGPGLYHVQHPTEDERAYLVDIAAVSCECPDYGCRGKHEGFRCKHILALVDDGKIEASNTDYASWFTPVQDPDQDDPYRD